MQQHQRRRLLPATVCLATLCVAALTACATSTAARTSSQEMTAVASINAWGSIVQQLGGTHVKTISIINNPDTDPHDYEPTPADARSIADASIVLENGVGYDSWADKAIAANGKSDQENINVGKLVDLAPGANPHTWYSPANVDKVADAITAAFKKKDPADADYFETQRRAFEDSGLSEYHRLISEIKRRYAGTPVGASESVFAPLAAALDLDVVTPPDFLKAISEGTDPSTADKATIDAQIKDKRMRVYVYNSQNATPDVAAQVKAARAVGIQVTTVTETLSPAGASFQVWQVAQLQALKMALAESTGK